MQTAFGVLHVLDELHRMLLFLFGLLLEQLRKKRQLPLTEVRGDGEVLHAGTEFAANLFVQRFRKLFAD